jgi:hypothetical protein
MRTFRNLRHGLARHDVPGLRLARLAVHIDSQADGLGGQLLAAAAGRRIRVAAEIGGVILVIDAKNDRAASWYAGDGAIPRQDTPTTLVMALPLFAAARFK